MHQLERPAQLDQIVARPKRRGMRVRDERQQLIEMLLHEGANLPVCEPFGRRVDRQHEARICALLIFREDDEFAGHDLFPVVVAHGARHQQQLAFLDLALEEWAARPGAFQKTALVLQDRAEHTQPAPGGQHTGAHHTTDARDLLPDHGPRQGRHGRGVEIAMRDVIEEIARRANAESLQRLGALGAYALEELDR